MGYAFNTAAGRIKTIKLTSAPRLTQPKNRDQEKRAGEVKVAGAMLTTSPTEW